MCTKPDLAGDHLFDVIHMIRIKKSVLLKCMNEYKFIRIRNFDKLLEIVLVYTMKTMIYLLHKQNYEHKNILSKMAIRQKNVSGY